MAMIVKVEYEEQRKSSAEWIGDIKRVVIDSVDVQDAIDKVKRRVLSDTYVITEDINGKKFKKPYKEEVVGFRLRGAEIMSETDDE